MATRQRPTCNWHRPGTGFVPAPLPELKAFVFVPCGPWHLDSLDCRHTSAIRPNCRSIRGMSTARSSIYGPECHLAVHIPLASVPRPLRGSRSRFLLLVRAQLRLLTPFSPQFGVQQIPGPGFGTGRIGAKMSPEARNKKAIEWQISGTILDFFEP